MARSQVQCLDDNHINFRTNVSKPDFFYSEEQRLALETLIQSGRDAFEDHIKTNNIRCFLSDLELERILNTAEAYCPGYPENNAELNGLSDEEEFSLQYWPDRSDCSIPQLDIGWPDWTSYRGVTRVQVYTQPPYEGQSHIKEVVRKMIAQAHKVIAIVMDLFTDIDIFKDLLDANYKRKVAVYIMLEHTGVKHFLRMCEKVGMHTGHLKNLRVRSIRGAEFFSRSSKRVCGSQNQKFMYIDGDKAVSGSYSFTWTASRLDRNLITVITGHAVDTFDRLFQDMYVMSNEVCLSKINLSSKPEPEIRSQTVPTPFPSATMALKLINPKYSLVCAVTTNEPVSDQTSAQNSNTKDQMEAIDQIKDTPLMLPVHPGLHNLEKANMIHYLPTWPDPEPPSDVIGFINIRDSNKTLQAHLMRSELFEVSQAIRFKEPFREPKKPLCVSACPSPKSQTPSDPEAPAQEQAHTEPQIRSEETQKHSKHFDQNQHQNTSQSEDLILPLQSPKPEKVHVLTCYKDDKEAPFVTNKELNYFPNSIFSSAKDDKFSDTKQTLDTPQSLKCPALNPNHFDLKLSLPVSNTTQCDSFAHQESITIQQTLNDKVIFDIATEDHRDTKLELKINEIHQNWNDIQISICDSTFSLSDEYFECIGPIADSKSEGDLESLRNQIKNIHQKQELPSTTAQDSTVCSDDQLTLIIPKLLKSSCSTPFNFSSKRFNTTIPTSPSKTTSDQASLSNYYCAPTSNGGFNFSSTSEEYFECSDMVDFESEFDGMIHEMEPNVLLIEEDLNINALNDMVNDSMSSVSQQIQKLSEMTIQKAEKQYNSEPSYENMKSQSGSQEQPEVTHIIETHIDYNNSRVVLQSKDNNQAQLNEKVKSGPILESESPSKSLPEHEINTPEMLEILSEGQSVLLAEKTKNTLLQDSQPHECLDMICASILRPSEANVVSKSHSTTDSESVQSSTLQDKAALTSVIPEMTAVTKSVESHKSEELQNSLADLHSGSNHSSSLEEAEKKRNSDPSYQNMKAVDEPKMQSRSQEQTAIQHAIETMAHSHLQADSRVVFWSEDDTQLDEKVQRLQTQEPEIKSGPIVERESLCSSVPEKINTPRKVLEKPAKGQLGEKTEKTPMQHLEFGVRLDLICEGPLVQVAEKIEKLPLLKPYVVGKSQLATYSESVRSLTLQDVTPVVTKKIVVTKSIELHKNIDELQKSLADLDSGSNHSSNLKSSDQVNEEIRLQKGEVSHQTVLKRKCEEDSPIEDSLKMPKQFESVELLIVEESDIQETTKNHCDHKRTRATMSKEKRLSKPEPTELKIINNGKQIDNKLDHDLYSKFGKKTCHSTALVEESQEGEHICANQVKKNLPEAKPKLECPVRKQPRQAPTRERQARGGLAKLPITKPDSSNRSLRPPVPKAGTYKNSPGKPLGQNKPSITASPSPEKLSTGGTATFRSTHMQQRPPWTVNTSIGPISPPKQPQVKLNKPKIRQSDEANSKIHSASTTKRSCKSFGI
ncbi:uncharacterized protein fam83ga [Xyrauchen texanus]|uniref:uncharacterized protein fam83ga n=1 Tax=Xyrauchen texanus TaxID=154827 RepID=UPI0022425135|nr:uncharacterized protein fam83ga [Xyrauchen texanus]